MKAKDIIQLLELGKTFKETKAKRSSRTKDMDIDDISLTMLMHRKLEEAEALKKLLEDYHKVHKKEDKKDESKWSLHHISYFLIATFPITAPLYVSYLRHMLT